MNLYSDNDLDFDDGLLEEGIFDMIPIVGTQNNDIGVSGRPIIGNQTILNDGTRWKVRDEILSDNFAHMPVQQAHWKWSTNDPVLVHFYLIIGLSRSNSLNLTSGLVVQISD